MSVRKKQRRLRETSGCPVCGAPVPGGPACAAAHVRVAERAVVEAAVAFVTKPAPLFDLCDAVEALLNARGEKP